jgi:hypothetical protein
LLIRRRCFVVVVVASSLFRRRCFVVVVSSSSSRFRRRRGVGFAFRGTHGVRCAVRSRTSRKSPRTSRKSGREPARAHQHLCRGPERGDARRPRWLGEGRGRGAEPLVADVTGTSSLSAATCSQAALLSSSLVRSRAPAAKRPPSREGARASARGKESPGGRESEPSPVRPATTTVGVGCQRRVGWKPVSSSEPITRWWK